MCVLDVEPKGKEIRTTVESGREPLIIIVDVFFWWLSVWRNCETLVGSRNAISVLTYEYNVKKEEKERKKKRNVKQKKI